MPTTHQEIAWEHYQEEKRLRGVRKETVRHHKTDRVRRRDWLPADGDEDGWDEMDSPASERIMPRGDAERRRNNLAKALELHAAPEEVTVPVDPPDTGAGESAAPDVPAERAEATTALRQAPAAAPPSRQGAPALAKPGAAAILPAPPVRCRARLPLRSDEGVVVEAGAGQCRVEHGGDVLLCALRGSLASIETGFANVVAVGDRVRLARDGDGRGVITAVLPRQGVLARPSPQGGPQRQLLAANVDQLLIVAAWQEPAFWPELVDRYLVTAALNGLAPLLAVNKVDLAPGEAAVRASLAPYLRLGLQVIFSSAMTGEGVPALRAALRGSTTVLAGLSGVGKSSLLAAVQPGLALRTAEISDHWHQGRHTTTQAVMLALETGGYVVDTPGIREFGLAGLTRRQLGHYYPEIARAAARCRFADCAHLDEPGCAVLAEVAHGGMAQVRYDNYRKIYATLPPG